MTPTDPILQAWMEEFQRRFGARLQGVLLYGSYTYGARDSLTDFYVLLDSYAGVDLPAWHGLLNKLLPPNVYQLALPDGARCKYALLPLEQFARCVERDYHCYFWARFAQPSSVLWVRDAAVEQQVTAALAAASLHFLDAVCGMVAAPANAQQLWQEGLQLTYRCELRAEAPSRAETLVVRQLDEFERRTADWAATRGYSAAGTGAYSGWPSGGAGAWRGRRWWGKALSVLRLMKAAATFNDGVDYLLWKIERHSGIYVQPTQRQRRWPLLCAWPLWWRLYRLGAFR